MLRQPLNLFHLTTFLVVAGVVAADIALVHNWPSFKRVLGAALGVELGLLIFLHFLALLFVVESFEHRLRRSYWFRWYFRLPSGDEVGDGPSVGARNGSWALFSRRIPAPLIKLGTLTAFFYGLETFLLPFLPIHLNIQAEILVVVLILAWHTVPFRAPDEVVAARQ